MPGEKLATFAALMQSLIDGTGEVNDAINRGSPSGRARLVGRLSIWLLLIFAFEGFVNRASRELGTESGFARRKKREPDEPDILIRLRLLRDDLGLELAVDTGENVLKRHFRLRNKWAHDLGILTEDCPEVGLSSIICRARPDEQAWVSTPAWSELRGTVGTLAQQILRLAGH